MAFSLKSVSKTKHAFPPRIGLLGDGGAGKSTLLSQCPGSIFIQTENGLSGIDSEAFPLAQSYNDVIEQLGVLAKEEHEYKAIWIDSADWLERLIHKHICEEQGVKTIELASGGYGKGYREATQLFKRVLDGLDWLRENKGMFTGFTCHARIHHVDDPEFEGGYDRYTLKLHSPKKGGGTNELLYEWADIIGFLKVSYQLGGQEVAKGEVKKLRNVEQKRILCTEGHAAYQAKNRYSLAPEIEIPKNEGWQSFVTALTNAQ